MTFTLNPVFLQGGKEYGFVALANVDDFTIYTARLGEKTLDDSRLVSKQLVLGSMFKSQNAETWTTEQMEDVKFKVNTVEFDTTKTGTVTLVNDEIFGKTLRQNVDNNFRFRCYHCSSYKSWYAQHISKCYDCRCVPIRNFKWYYFNEH